jgi:hypothetical protein
LFPGVVPEIPCSILVQVSHFWHFLTEIGIFQLFLVHFCGDVGFWVKNGGWCVNLRSLDKEDKKNVQKNGAKMVKNL